MYIVHAQHAQNWTIMKTKEIEAFFLQFKCQKYRKGEILIRADDEPLGVLYLTKGAVIEYVITEKGTEAILEFFIPHSILPLSWAINDVANSRYYEAYDEVEVYRAPKDAFAQFIGQNPEVLSVLLHRVCKDAEYTKKRLASWMSGDAYARVVGELLLLAEATQKIDNQPGPVRITHFVERYAAARTGLTQETVSREIKKLKAKNLITLQSNILIIKDLEKLELELENY